MDEHKAITPRAANITRSCWRISSITRPDTPTQSISEARRYWHGAARAPFTLRAVGSIPLKWVATPAAGAATPLALAGPTAGAASPPGTPAVQDGGARERTIARNTVLGNGSDGIRLITAPSVVVIGNQVPNNT